MTEDAGAEGAGRRTFFRDVGLVARFELAEAVRSRLLAVMLLLFVGAGAVGAWGYTEILGRVEENAAKIIAAPQTKRPGAMSRRLKDSASYRDLIRKVVRDDAKADYFAQVPPIVLFFGWASFLFTPWFVLFTSAETIASEVGGRTIRYSLLRTGKLEYALGKSVGQAIILAGVTAVSAVAFFCVAWAGLSGFEAGETALGLLSYWPRVLVYNLPFLAWAMLASMVTASANVARVVALAGAVVLAIGKGLSGKESWRENPIAASLLDVVGYLVPFGHYDGLVYPPGGELGRDLAICAALAVLYFAAGYARLKRRDV